MTIAHCPDDLALAAYLEERLSPPARQGIVEHLADCERCAEVVAEATRFLEPRPDGLVVSIESHRPPHTDRLSGTRRFAWIAAAVIAVGLGAVYLRSPSQIPTEPGLAAALGAELARTQSGELADRVWHGFPAGLAFADTVSPSTLAFRWGVATVDLETAEARGDSAAARRVVEEIEAWGVALDAKQRRALAGLRSPDSADRANGIAELRAVESQLEQGEQTGPAYALGRWAEAGRLAAVGGDEAFLRTAGFAASRPAATFEDTVSSALARIDVLMPAGTTPWDLPTLALHWRDLILLH